MFFESGISIKCKLFFDDVKTEIEGVFFSLITLTTFLLFLIIFIFYDHELSAYLIILPFKIASCTFTRLSTKFCTLFYGFINIQLFNINTLILLARIL